MTPHGPILLRELKIVIARIDKSKTNVAQGRGEEMEVGGVVRLQSSSLIRLDVCMCLSQLVFLLYFVPFEFLRA